LTSAVGPAHGPGAVAGGVSLLALVAVARPPIGQPFTLDEAVRGLDGEGELSADIETALGLIRIRLFEAEAPKTVANFVGLARGLRRFRDPADGRWVRRPFYDGLTFHRAVPKLLIQGGCPLGDGRGGPGYFIEDELSRALTHVKPGMVSMANDGPNTNGSQFFITEAPAPHLDGKNPVFGEVVSGLDVVYAIGRASLPVSIRRVTIHRVPDRQSRSSRLRSLRSLRASGLQIHRVPLGPSVK
jgi:peptidyl-prolyl cis-trans isomerase A (cyclophilin A)